MIGFVKFIFCRFLEAAKAKGVNRVNAAVIARPVSSGDHVDGYLDLFLLSVLNILTEKVSGFNLPIKLYLVIDHF